jgi:Domain of unknown function (DUF4304)
MITSKEYKQSYSRILKTNFNFNKAGEVWQRRLTKYWIQVYLQKSSWSDEYIINYFIYEPSTITQSKNGAIKKRYDHIARVDGVYKVLKLSNISNIDQLDKDVLILLTNTLEPLITNLENGVDWIKLKELKLLMF